MQFNEIDIAKYYYYVKPLIPRRMQIQVRRWVAVLKRKSSKNVWPIDYDAGKKPERWQGWPDNKRFALVLTHDVDTSKGHDKCCPLMQMEETLGFKSSFNFVAARYRVSQDLRRHLVGNGFEVGIHGLYHDRSLFESRETFRKQAEQINNYLMTWESVGFRSPCMYRNLEWIRDLHIKYDSSTFDTDPFEPQPDGVGTIFPFSVKGDLNRKGYVELPYTLPQDFTLFILFRENDIGIWKQKLKWVAEHGGMVLLNTHPDYMNFAGKPGYEEYPARYYQDFLQHVASEYGGQYWHALPHEMANFWDSSQGDDG